MHVRYVAPQPKLAADGHGRHGPCKARPAPTAPTAEAGVMQRVEDIMRALLALTLLAIACTAAINIDAAGASDQVVLWFDVENEMPCQGGSPFVPVTLHVVLLEPTSNHLYGWEAAVRSAQGEIYVLGSSVAYGGSNSAVGGEFRVEYAEPLEVGAKTVLASVTILPTAPETCFIVTGISNPSLPVPGPIVWTSADVPAEIGTADYFFNGVDAVLGWCGSIPEDPYVPCRGALAASPLSWGALKSQYR